MSKEKKNGRSSGLWLEIIVLALLIGLSMMFGIRLYCREWVDACSSAIWIACWVVWYKIWKDKKRYQAENRHLKGMVSAAIIGLEAVKHSLHDDDDDEENRAEAGAQKGDSQADEK